MVAHLLANKPNAPRIKPVNTIFALDKQMSPEHNQLVNANRYVKTKSERKLRSELQKSERSWDSVIRRMC